MDTILGVARHVLNGAGGFLVGKGLLEQGQVEPLVGAVLLIVATAWSIYDKKKRK